MHIVVIYDTVSQDHIGNIPCDDDELEFWKDHRKLFLQFDQEIYKIIHFEQKYYPERIICSRTTGMHYTSSGAYYIRIRITWMTIRWVLVSALQTSVVSFQVKWHAHQVVIIGFKEKLF